MEKVKVRGGVAAGILALILLVILYLAGSIVALILNGVVAADSLANVDEMESLMVDLTGQPLVAAEGHIIFAIVALIIFVIWYRLKFIRPFLMHPQKDKRHLSLLSFLALIILAVGLFCLSIYLMIGMGKIMPDQMASYNEMIEKAAGLTGFDLTSVLTVIYAVILAPIMEETVFRGIVMRSALGRGGVWFAIIFQAVLFGIYHLNLIQGIYAAIMGVFFGYIAYKGGGIRYSLIMHIIYNMLNYICGTEINNATTMFPKAVLGLTIAVIVFALYVFTDDFQVIKTEPRRASSAMDLVEDLNDEPQERRSDRRAKKAKASARTAAPASDTRRRPVSNERPQQTRSQNKGSYTSGGKGRYDYGDDEY